MATVHRAVKRGIEGFEREVALKRLLPHLAEDEKFVQSFVREARLASLLQHTNVIQIYDLGIEESIYYIAMEYVRGFDLRQILRQTAYATGPMPVPIGLALLGQLCDALDYAHNASDPQTGEALGIVHRDISPSNALVTTNGHLKVIDFGVAKARAEQLATHSGRLKGKFSYMAPEALAGTDLDGRSDIFSVGVIAWELLTARPLFSAHRDFEAIRAIRQQEVPPPSTHNPECPAELDEVVLLALAKERDKRWQSAGALRNALDSVAFHMGRASHRDTAEWLQWLFSQTPSKARWSDKPKAPIVSKAVETQQIKRSKPKKARALTEEEIASIEIVWPGNTGADKPPETVLSEDTDGSDVAADERADTAQPTAPEVNDDDPTLIAGDKSTVLYSDPQAQGQVKAAIQQYQEMLKDEPEAPRPSGADPLMTPSTPPPQHREFDGATQALSRPRTGTKKSAMRWAAPLGVMILAAAMVVAIYYLR